jgi:hypothetical protein
MNQMKVTYRDKDSGSRYVPKTILYNRDSFYVALLVNEEDNSDLLLGCRWERFPKSSANDVWMLLPEDLFQPFLAMLVPLPGSDVKTIADVLNRI